MKHIFYIFILLSCTAFSFSCSKLMPENRIVGEWRLAEVQKRRAFSNDNIQTGYENGSFKFYENGAAAFTDNLGQMTGNWQMRKRADGKVVFVITLQHFSTNRFVNWYFDNLEFRSPGNKLFAYIESVSYTYRYDFRKQ